MNDPLYQQWLKERHNGIGGSDAAAILGLSPYKTNVELWEEKVGLREAVDISDEEYVQYGREAEEHLIALYALNHPQYDVSPNTDYTVIKHKDYPFLFATLDGRLYEKNKPFRKGILEVKTALILNSIMRQKWKDAIPDQYFVQVLHYMLVTGWEFAEITALLRWDYGDGVKCEIRNYHIERRDVLPDLDYLLHKEVDYWVNHVEAKQRPHLILPPL